MKIAILYICTGNYSMFWDSFYKSSELFFLNNHEKHYFVFTDSKTIKNSEFINIIYESPKGFPLDSLLRFKMFLKIEEKLSIFDYVFFLNSNMMFVAPVGAEILPDNEHNGIVATLHPGYYNKKYYSYTYERNRNSTAFIPYEKNKQYYYYMGGFNGGTTKDFLKLSKTCNELIEEDLKKGIIAIYHDESYLNKYLHDLKVLILSPSYGFPEDSDIPLIPKIIILNKIKHGGKYFDKLPKRDYLKRIRLKISRIVNLYIWKYC